MKGKYLLFFALCMVSLSVVVSSCKTDNGDEKTTSVAEELNEAQPTSDTKAVSGPDTVVISGMKFNPQHLTIQKGDTVVWFNNGIVVHDVTVDSLATWTSDSIQVGETWSKVPKEEFDYFCSIHPTMKGSITVKEK